MVVVSGIGLPLSHAPTTKTKKQKKQTAAVLRDLFVFQDLVPEPAEIKMMMDGMDAIDGMAWDGMGWNGDG
jgi:hypothetical protein